MANACIAQDNGGGPALVGGYPLSVLVRGLQKRGEKVSFSGNVLRIINPDPLTGHADEFRLQLAPAAAPGHSDSCGPGAVLVERMSANGTVFERDQVYTLLPSFVQGAAAALGASKPVVTDDGPQPSYPGAPPVGTHPQAVVAPQGSFGFTPKAGQGALEGMPPPSGYVDGPQMGECADGSCAWSKTLNRSVQVAGDGTRHVLTLLGGTTTNGDQSATDVRWDSAPHTVSILCSKTTPQVTMGNQVDDLPLNAQGSQVPGVLMDSYSIYAAECHPEAKDLDPDAFAKRFGYQAKLES